MEIMERLVSGSEDIRVVAALADRIWREYYTPFLPEGQVDYMLQTIQSEKAIVKQIRENVTYGLILVDGFPAGYYAVRSEGTRLFLSKAYLLREYRGKRIFRIMFSYILHHGKGKEKIYLTVNRGNEDSIRIYQHIGFRIIQEEKADIGNGYVMDDYIMEYSLER